jgi:flagellin-like hook-associated protein FlgL
VVSTGQQQLQFDATTGKLSTINGAAPQKITINDKTDKINFSIDASNLTEGTSGNVSSSLSQPTNILNAIQSIADTLSAGKLPTDAQENLLNDFNNRLLQKITQVGGVQNRLTDTSDMLTSQQTQLQDLLSKERDTDVAKASIDLQSAQYTTEMLYKTSAMILPKSLLDYMA